MYAYDFEYDGQYLSDYGFIICSFDGQSDYDTISAGSKITFNTVSRHGGKTYGLTGTVYEECIQSEFSICKNPCLYDDLKITNDEYRDIMRWLNRREFLKLRFIDEEIDGDTCFYDSSFNVDKIISSGALYGLNLTMETNKPFGYGQEISYLWTVTDVTKSHTVYDMSDEIGYTFPSMVITINESGDLTVTNDSLDCEMEIKNCTVGEVITVYGDTQIIDSSLNSHKIYDDFNFEFLYIGNTINKRENKISVSLPCKIEMKYNPIIKNTPD